MIKTQLRKSLIDCIPFQLMRFTIEITEVVSESDIKEILDLWQ